MNFDYSERQAALLAQVRAFMGEHVYPAVPLYEEQLRAERWRLPAVVESLKARARAQGLWNLFLPADTPGAEPRGGAGLTNLEYAPLAEEMGRVGWASEVFNCSAPDTGNMEVLHRFGTQEQKARWLQPLLTGEIRSAYCMTEREVASSDATNVRMQVVREGNSYVLNGRKWWVSGLGDPRCRILIVMAKTAPSEARHRQQSQILVPADTPGIRIERHLGLFGYDDAPHGHAEVSFEDVRVPVENVLLGEGRGFEIAQGRLGPGRIHHCMRTIGLAEVCLELMVRRLLTREAFGRRLADQSYWEQKVAAARIDIEMTRLLTLKAADMMDKVGNKTARAQIAMIKAAGPRVALKIIDDAIQAHGAAGLTEDFGLARAYARVRALRIADGPDEVHGRTVARLEYARYPGPSHSG